MGRLINADALMETLERGDWVHVTDYNIAIYAVKDAPTVDAVPVRKGQWRHYEGALTCSECGTEYYDDIIEWCGDHVPKFCPNCGANMREDGDQ